MRGSLVLAICAAAACANAPRRASVSCDFPPVESATDHVAECAEPLADGGFVVRPEALVRAHFRQEDVAEVAIAGTLYLVNRAGRTAPALPFDNGADAFVEGLARTVRNGKVGFVDTALTEVIPAQWDFAFPFEGGVARVCNGCAGVPASPGEEHHAMAGGTWGYIDTTGRVVVPVTFDRDRLPTPPAAGGTHEPPARHM
jgi:WG containing repeat